MVKFLRKIPCYDYDVYTHIYIYPRSQHPSRSTKDARWIIKFPVAGNGSCDYGLARGRFSKGARATTREFNAGEGRETKKNAKRSMPPCSIKFVESRNSMENSWGEMMKRRAYIYPKLKGKKGKGEISLFWEKTISI